MADETGRVEAAARQMLDTEWDWRIEGKFKHATRDHYAADCPLCRPDYGDNAQRIARTVLAAADRFDREHGIARIKLDGELRRQLLLALAAADSQNLVGVDLGHTAETMYGALSDAVLAVLRVLREAAEHA